MKLQLLVEARGASFNIIPEELNKAFCNAEELNGYLRRGSYRSDGYNNVQRPSCQIPNVESEDFGTYPSV